MIFALLHATLGWALAGFAALLLRRRSADARCWAWRLGLLKGPLALLLAVPVAVSLPPLTSMGVEASQRDASQERQRGLVARGDTDGPIAHDPLPTLPQGGGHDPVLRTRLASKDVPTGRSSEKQGMALPLGEGRSGVDAPTASVVPLAPSLYLLGLLVTLALRVATRESTHPGPRVTGVFRPRILIPEGLDPASAGMALAHEGAHVRRRDPLWSLVADLVCLGFWFAPPVWRCARAMRAEAEAACDAEALSRTGASQMAYARLLLDFAGPAPANALGGPARRLARRILMLERTPRPLSRSVASALALAGVLVVLPWRAVARTAPLGVEAPRKTEMPFRISLDRAMLDVFAQPGVKAQIGWAATQEAALQARQRRYDAAWRPYAAREAEIRRTKSLNEWVHFSMNAIPTRERAERAAGPMPWTVRQEAELKRRALARFGGALWLESEVAKRLGLTPQQRHAALVADSEVLRRTTALVPKMPPLPKAVNDLVVWTQAKYFAAAPTDRPRYRAQIERLVRKYRKKPTPTRKQ